MTTSGFWSSWGALLAEGWRAIKHGGSRLLALMLVCYLILLLLATPVINWIFREALRADGLIGLDFGDLQLTGGLVVTTLLVLLLIIVVLWLTVLQFAVIILALDRVRRGDRLTLRGLGPGMVRVLRKLLRPNALVLALYVFLIVPVSGFGFVSVMTQGIVVPPFVSAELMKSPVTAVLWTLLMLTFAWVNLRLAVSLPMFVLTDRSGGRSMRASWSATRGRGGWALACAVVTVLVLAAVVTLLMFAVAVLPTMVTDAAMPGASPATAAFSLALAQVVGALILALVTASCIGMLLAITARAETPVEGPQTPPAPIVEPQGRIWPTRIFVVATSLIVAAVLGVSNIEFMHRLSQHPDTLVIGHRGYVEGGVENTIEALEAAAKIDVDAVEMDVLQTKDRGFIVMHDGNLSRLTGQDINVKDRTVDELTQMQVSDSSGHQGAIPSLEQYVTRAQELGMPLLMEIKVGGLDTPDHVDLLVAELEKLGALPGTTFHSLDHASVERLKQLRPDATVGYIMPFADDGMPLTHADFVVIEEASADEELQSEAGAADLGFVVWTVDEPETQRDLLRRGASAIITDNPEAALEGRSEIQHETGLAGALFDLLIRFIPVL